jgi:hypothetical protein
MQNTFHKAGAIRADGSVHAAAPTNRYALHVQFPRRRSMQPKVTVADAFPDK